MNFKSAGVKFDRRALKNTKAMYLQGSPRQFFMTVHDFGDNSRNWCKCLKVNVNFHLLKKASIVKE